MTHSSIPTLLAFVLVGAAGCPLERSVSRQTPEIEADRLPVAAVRGPARAQPRPPPPARPKGSGKGPGGQSELYNAEAVVPPMCYTKTLGKHNPCYVCHQDAPVGFGRTNQANDAYLQGDYNFSDTALKNHWTNLFVDRRQAITEISDQEARDYIGQDNFTALAAKLDARGWRDLLHRRSRDRPDASDRETVLVGHPARLAR